MAYEYTTAALKTDGLSATQKSVLLAYCIRADEHGYCYPSRQRIADDMSLSIRAVNYAKVWLVENGLIVPRKRRHSETGRQTTDAVRVNLAAMQRMARPEKEYGDNLIEEITLPEETAGYVQGASPAPLPRDKAPEGCISC